MGQLAANPRNEHLTSRFWTTSLTRRARAHRWPKIMIENKTTPKWTLRDCMIMCSGWLIVGSIGCAAAIYGCHNAAVLAMTLIGLVSAFVSFGSLEMPLVSIIAGILGWSFTHVTQFGLIAPWAIDGFLVSCLVGHIMDRWKPANRVSSDGIPIESKE